MTSTQNLLRTMRQDLDMVIKKYHYLCLARHRSRIGRTAVRISRRLDQVARVCARAAVSPETVMTEIVIAWAHLEECMEQMPNFDPRNSRWAIAEALESLRQETINMMVRWGHEFPEIRILLPQELRIVLLEEQDAMAWKRREEGAEIIDVEPEEEGEEPCPENASDRESSRNEEADNDPSTS